MGNTKYVGAFLFLVVLAGCDSTPQNDQTQTLSAGPAGDTAPAISSLRDLPTIKDGGGTTVAYVAGLLSNGVFLLYLQGTSQYAYVDSQTGTYGVGDANLYFTGSGCTGTAMATRWLGEVGKTVLFDGTHYYLVSSEYTIGTVFSEGSGVAGSPCGNFIGTYTTIVGDAHLTATTQPYDFAALAPLTPSF